MIVVDASVALKWFVPEPGSAEAERLLVDDLPRAAPSHLLVEIGQAMLRHYRPGRVTIDHCRSALRACGNLVTLFPTEALATDALDIAAEASCSIYDALYVAAADRWGCWLTTADAKLRSQLVGSRWHSRVVLLQDDFDPTRLKDEPR